MHLVRSCTVTWTPCRYQSADPMRQHLCSRNDDIFESLLGMNERGGKHGRRSSATVCTHTAWHGRWRTTDGAGAPATASGTGAGAAAAPSAGAAAAASAAAPAGSARCATRSGVGRATPYTHATRTSITPGGGGKLRATRLYSDACARQPRSDHFVSGFKTSVGRASPWARRQRRHLACSGSLASPPRLQSACLMA